MTDPDFTLFPIYYTDSINVDSWGLGNPYINEVNESNPYAYAVEMNAAVASEKGLADGDKIRLVSQHDSSVEGILMTSEKIHPNAWPSSADHGAPIRSLFRAARARERLSPTSRQAMIPSVLTTFARRVDQTVRVKVEKIS